LLILIGDWVHGSCSTLKKRPRTLNKSTIDNQQSKANHQSPITNHQLSLSQYTPTVVVDAKPWKGLTPLTPSHG
jgi:hypothetical protein